MINKIIRLAEKFPPTFFLGYELLAKVPALLPHDKSYLIFRHFMQSEEGLILDIGANNGISSVYFHHLRPQWKIVAFEPNPFHQKAMERLRRTFKNFDYHLIGLSSQGGRMTFYTPTCWGIPLHTATSLKAQNFEALKDFYPRFIFNQLEIQEHKTIVKALDDLKLQPDVIKIDCEGWDFEVLKGSIKTLKQYRPYVLLENQESYYSALVRFCQDVDMEVLFYDFKKNRLIKKQSSPTTDENEQRNLVIIPKEKIGNIGKKISIIAHV